MVLPPAPICLYDAVVCAGIVFVLLYPHHNNQRGMVIEGLVPVSCELQYRKWHTVNGVLAAALFLLLPRLLRALYV